MKWRISLPVMSMAACLMLSAARAGESNDQIVLRTLKEAGAVAYSHKSDYSKGIHDMYLGYDEHGEIVAGSASREIRTYKKVTSLLTVKKEGGAWRIYRVEMPDIGKIKEQKNRNKVLSSVSDLLGRIMVNGEGEYRHIDAVTGATPYYKRIYANHDFLAKRIIGEIRKNPGWTRLPLP